MVVGVVAAAAAAAAEQKRSSSSSSSSRRTGMAAVRFLETKPLCMAAIDFPKEEAVGGQHVPADKCQGRGRMRVIQRDIHRMMSHRLSALSSKTRRNIDKFFIRELIVVSVKYSSRYRVMHVLQ